MDLLLNLPLATRLANHRAGKGYLNHGYTIECGTYDNEKVTYFTSLDKLKSVWRFTGDVGDIVRLRHRGWYADEFQEETYTGFVCQLPARGGQEQFLAGWYASDSDIVVVFHDIHDDKEEAARIADEYARVAADEARECVEKDRMEREIEEARERVAEIGEEMKSLLAEYETVKACGHVLASITIAKRVESLNDELHALETKIADAA